MNGVQKTMNKTEQIIMHMICLENLMCKQICHRCAGCIECATAFAIMAKKITEETDDSPVC